MFYITHSVLNLIVCLIWSFGSKKLSGDGAKSVMSNVMRGVGCRRTKCFVRKLFEIKSHWPNEWLITCSHPHPKCWLLLENVLCQKNFQIKSHWPDSDPVTAVIPIPSAGCSWTKCFVSKLCPTSSSSSVLYRWVIDILCNRGPFIAVFLGW